ncbi:plasmid mobilization protein [Rhodospirillum sp. A1_3_36]|uniref:plasmid mobilization protein n=1 Tax=Rhodospirillum sp. A1_3_36 TaxID=3391666 RepID=UPI0039A715FD
MRLKDKTVRLRMSSEEEIELKNLAQSHQKTVSQYIRDCIKLRQLGHTQDTREDIVLLRREIAAIGNNLNQVAKYTNSTKQATDLTNLITSLKKIKDKINKTL